jgi:hypothetical protein
MDRYIYTPQTTLLKSIDIPLNLIGQGSGKAPKLGEGDPNATFFSQPVFVSTGIFTLTTLDVYAGLVSVIVDLAAASPAYNSVCVEGPVATQNSNNTWTFTFNNFYTGSAADVLTTDYVRLRFAFRNSSVQA